MILHISSASVLFARPTECQMQILLKKRINRVFFQIMDCLSAKEDLLRLSCEILSYFKKETKEFVCFF